MNIKSVNENFNIYYNWAQINFRKITNKSRIPPLEVPGIAPSEATLVTAAGL